MNWIVTWLLIGLVCWMLLSGARRTGRIYEFPFLAAAITFAFILPQLPGLANDPFLPDGAYERAVVFTILCVAMCWLGWMPDRPVMKAFRWQLDERRLLIASAGLSLIGAYFYYQLGRIPIEQAVATQFTGWYVVLFFFSKLLPYGLCVALLCLLRRPSYAAIGITLFDAVFYLDRIFVTGKRGETTELVLMVALAVWFQRRRAIPYILLLAGILGGTVMMSSTEDYRDLSRAKDRPESVQVTQLSPWQRFEKLLETGGPEMRNAIFRINAVEQSMVFDYGLFHWNILVFNYVPAQIVGRSIKEALLIQIDGQYARDYDPPNGTTETGMSDAFASLWFFGAIKFFIIAFVLSRLYGAAMAGYAVPQLFYMLLIVPGMHSISHHTQWLLTEWIQVMLLLVPALCYARIPHRDEAPIPALATGMSS